MTTILNTFVWKNVKYVCKCPLVSYKIMLNYNFCGKTVSEIKHFLVKAPMLFRGYITFSYKYPLEFFSCYGKC